MVEATGGFRLHPTSILDVYKVFWHLDILFIGICVSILTLLGLCRRWGFGFFFWGVDLSLSDVVMSWLRLQAGSRLHPTSILDVYTVFWKLGMV